jgi:hypothetical protein
VHTVAAVVKAHKSAEKFARRSAAALAIIADEGQHRRVGHVYFAKSCLLFFAVQPVPVITEILRQVSIVAGSVPGDGDIGSHLQAQRVVRSAATTVPVVTDLVDTKELGLGVVTDTCVNGIRILLLHTGRAHADLLGQQLHVLSDSQAVCTSENAPVLGREGTEEKETQAAVKLKSSTA